MLGLPVSPFVFSPKSYRFYSIFLLKLTFTLNKRNVFPLKSFYIENFIWISLILTLFFVGEASHFLGRGCSVCVSCDLDVYSMLTSKLSTIYRPNNIGTGFYLLAHHTMFYFSFLHTYKCTNCLLYMFVTENVSCSMCML